MISNSLFFLVFLASPHFSFFLSSLLFITYFEPSFTVIHFDLETVKTVIAKQFMINADPPLGSNTVLSQGPLTVITMHTLS